jgi:hypothetical protein
MANHDYPSTATIADALTDERRGINWAKGGIEFAHQNLLVAANEIPDTPEYAEVRRAVYRALDRIRGARAALTEAYDTTVEAMLVAERSPAVPITNRRLLERYGGQRGDNGATQVRNARKERQRREDDYAAWERRRREEERQRFLKNRKGEGMRENED